MIRAAICTLFVSLLFLMTSPAVARACSCLPSGLGMSVMPAEGMYAPRNTRIWVAHGPRLTPSSGLEVVLLDGGGQVVPTNRSEIASGSAEWLGIVVLTPRAPLPANSAFVIQLHDVTGTMTTTRFFTSDTLDVDRPAVPQVLDADVDPGDSGGRVVSCASEGWLGLRMSADAWIIKRDPASASYVSFDPEHLSGVLEDFAAHIDGDAMLAYGGSCNAAPWHGFPAEMQFATLDLAGNFSGWSDTQRFAPKANAAAACSIAGPGSEPPYRVPAVWFLAAAALLVRRRARRRDV
jgi:MYXO-CTERM domain-containing protein